MGHGGVEGFLAELRGLRRIAVDTCCCIYFLEGDPARHPLMRALFMEAARGRIEIELAGVVFLELLIRPFKSGDRRELERVLQLTRRFPGVKTVEMSQRVIFATAEVRAATGLKVPDALVVGSAAVGGCQAVLGNDHRFRGLNLDTEVRLAAFGRQPIALPRYIEIDDFVPGPAQAITDLRKRKR